MKLWLASTCLWWLVPLGVVCYSGGMILVSGLMPILGETPFYLLVAFIMIGGWKIKRWADETVAWHESIKRFR